MLDGWRAVLCAAALFASAPQAASAQTGCEHDREALLALPEQAFDQDLTNGGGGWRSLAAKPECGLVAAELLRDYRKKHDVQGGIMAWHEGQLRAGAGQYEHAEALFESARKPQGEPDPIGWNHYIDASVAFLRGDRSALLAARERLAQVPHDPGSGMPPVKDGYIEFPSQDGRPAMRMRWPPNIEVVDGLIQCFGRPYNVAYGAPECRTGSAPRTPEAKD